MILEERRQAERTAINTPAEIRDLSGSVIAHCVICNQSDGGAKLQFEADVDLPKEFLLMLAGMRTLGRRCQVIWRIGNKVGVRFAAGAAANALAGAPMWAAK